MALDAGAGRTACRGGVVIARRTGASGPTVAKYRRQTSAGTKPEQGENVDTAGTARPQAEPIASAGQAVVPFSFEGKPVRAVTIEGEPYLVGKDVAERLGYARPNDAIQLHCKGAAIYRPLQTSGGTQEVRVLSEPDVLRLIIGSNLPAAERFERWVFEEVLPAIRNTGVYVAPGTSGPTVAKYRRQTSAST